MRGDRHVTTDHPMTAAELWLNGLIVGLALGLPVGILVTLALGPVDRWLDDRWRQ